MKIYGAIRTAIYWILGILIIVFISTLAEIEVLRYFIGGLMIFYGADEILVTAVRNKRHYPIYLLYWFFMEIIIGFTLVVFVKTGDVEVTYAVVCVCWAIWSILREDRELIELSKQLKKNKPIGCKIVAITSLLESLTVIVLSLMMLIEPGKHHAEMHLYLLVVEMFTKMLFPIINHAAEHLAEKKKGKAENTVADGTLSEPIEGKMAVSSEEQQPADVPEEDQTTQDKNIGEVNE